MGCLPVALQAAHRAAFSDVGAGHPRTDDTPVAPNARLLSLAATQFPEVRGMAFSWLESLLKTLK